MSAKFLFQPSKIFKKVRLGGLSPHTRYGEAVSPSWGLPDLTGGCTLST